MIFINPLVETIYFVMAVQRETCVPMHPHIFFFEKILIIEF